MSSTYLMGTCQTESKQGIELLLQIGLCGGTYELVDELSVLEEHDGRDVADTEVDCHVVSVIDVALGDDDLSVIFRSDFVHDGSEHTARTAPGGPEIDHYRLVGSQYFRNVGIGYNL